MNNETGAVDKIENLPEGAVFAVSESPAINEAPVNSNTISPQSNQGIPANINISANIASHLDSEEAAERE